MDILCIAGTYEVFCGYVCGNASYTDLTKLSNDEFDLIQGLKDMLSYMINKFDSEQNLYTLGFEVYTNEIRIYLMEMRVVYRLHLLKRLELPTQFSSYRQLRSVLLWAWNLRVNLFVANLWYNKINIDIDVSSTLPKSNNHKMSTPTTPPRAKKNKEY
nr:6974_t:CDS:2 [Entrophospora candida]